MAHGYRNRQYILPFLKIMAVPFYYCLILHLHAQPNYPFI